LIREAAGHDLPLRLSAAAGGTDFTGPDGPCLAHAGLPSIARYVAKRPVVLSKVIYAMLVPFTRDRWG